MADVSTYTSLITSEHADKPKYMALIAMIAQCYVDAQNVLASIPAAYDLDVAVGAQLDTDALWIGAKRGVDVPITDVYFSFDTDGLGWDEGVWYGPYMPETYVQSLDDDSFRLLCKFKVAANNWDGTLPTLYAALSELFAPATVTIYDHAMECTITITGNPPTTLFKQLVLDYGLPIRTAGVPFTYIFA